MRNVTSHLLRRAIIRRASMAETNLDKRIQQFAEDRWRDMGAVFVTLAVYTSRDGQLVVDR
jgi:hypothetical protein